MDNDPLARVKVGRLVHLLGYRAPHFTGQRRFERYRCGTHLEGVVMPDHFPVTCLTCAAAWR